MYKNGFYANKTKNASIVVKCQDLYSKVTYSSLQQEISWPDFPPLSDTQIVSSNTIQSFSETCIPVHQSHFILPTDATYLIPADTASFKNEINKNLNVHGKHQFKILISIICIW
jgi:hypothetical protein